MNPLSILCVLISIISATAQTKYKPLTQVDLCAEFGYAIAKRDVERVKFLLDHEEVPQSLKDWAVRAAAKDGHKDCVHLLRRYGADPEAMESLDPYAEFDEAVKQGSVERVKFLLDNTMIPKKKKDRAIHSAAQEGHVDCVQLLLDYGANPATRDNKPIQLAASHGHEACVKILLSDKRVDPTATGDFALRYAAFYGHAGCIKLLLADKRVNPAAENNWAIYWAAYSGHLECVKLLLADPRVDPSAVPLDGLRPEIRSLIECVVKLGGKDLAGLQQVHPTTLSNDMLDILISRKHGFLEVQLYLVGIQISRLAIPEAVKKDPAYMAMISQSLSKGVWGIGRLCELTETFSRLKHIHLLFSEFTCSQ